MFPIIGRIPGEGIRQILAPVAFGRRIALPERRRPDLVAPQSARQPSTVQALPFSEGAPGALIESVELLK